MKKAFIIIFIFFLTAQNSHAENFKAATAEWPPYAMEDGNEITGIAVDILKEIIKRTGNTIIINLYPAARLNLYFDNNKIDINFADSILWNEVNSDSLFVFSDPYMSVNEYIYFLKENYINVSKPSDLEGKLVGITRGYYYAMFEDVFNKAIVDKENANSNKTLLWKLKAGRNDAIFMDDVLFNYLISKSDTDQTLFKRGLKITTAPLGLKIRIEKKNVLAKFNKTILEMKKQGMINKIINKYIPE